MSLSHVRFFATPYTVAYQVPPPMGFSRQEYWSGCHHLLWLVTEHLAKRLLAPLLSTPQQP